MPLDKENQRLFELAVGKFNEHEFYECHDILEDIWFDSAGSERDFYQGLIHLAVSFYHITVKKNPNGAILQLSKAINKLTKFKPQHNGVELVNLLEKSKECLKIIEKIKAGTLKKFDTKLIPQIKRIR